MQNTKSRIKIHKNTMKKPQQSPHARICNCIKKFKWPLNSKCLSNVLNKTKIKSMIKNYRIYYGITQVKFKARYVKSFRNTELSDEIRKLKEQNQDVDILWEILVWE